MTEHFDMNLPLKVLSFESASFVSIFGPQDCVCKRRKHAFGIWGFLECAAV